MDIVGNVHLVAGNSESTAHVLALLKSAGIETRGNPDLYIREYAQFGADDARELRERTMTRAIAGTRRAFVIQVTAITNEAQNILLKTLEEPPVGSLFFFIVPNPHMLLPTLRSRMQMLDGGATRSIAPVDAKAFLAANPSKRLDMLKPLLEKGDDDKRDLGGIIAFLSDVEKEIATLPDKANRAEALYRARKYLGDRGSLVKPLLEQVALLV